MSSRRQEPPVEDSWRIVDGDNDSFDTSILPSLASDDGHSSPAPLSSGQPSSGFPSQLSSQGNASLASQDSIRDFARHPEDDHNILFEPFRPSLPSARNSPRQEQNRTPDPEFRMPVMRIDSGDRRGPVRRSPRGQHSAGQGDEGLRRRVKTSTGSPIKRRNPRRGGIEEYEDGDERPRTVRNRLADSLPSAVYDALIWVAGVFALAFRYSQRPLALLLAVYLFFGGIIVTQNMVTKSIFVSLSPVCRIPGVSYLQLPFCPASEPVIPENPRKPVEFEDLMDVQSKFEEVLEKSAEAVSLPLEMKRSEMDVRDLRTLVKHSELPHRDELSLEFDGYVGTVRDMSSDLQKFNIHVGGAVDRIISINRWTSHRIRSLSPPSDDDQPSSEVADWAAWLFYPFQPEDTTVNERWILDTYVEHTAFMSERIADLIFEAQSILRLLGKAEDHLAVIYEITTRSSASVGGTPRDDILYYLRTLLLADMPPARSQKHQLALLKRVNAQRSSAVSQVNALVLELESMQASLNDVRDRLAGPQLLTTVPLSVHLDTIDRGLDRLERARERIQVLETDRFQEMVARRGEKQGNLVGGK